MDPISEIIKNQSDDIPTPEKTANSEQNQDNEPVSKRDSIDDIKIETKEEQPLENDKEVDESSSSTSQKQLVPLVERVSQQLETIITLLENIETGGSTLSSKVIKELEGVFDGKEMIASNTERFKVPIDFINKHKLVEGDLLKLEVKENKTYKYRQIGSVNRKRIVGTLVFNEKIDQWKIETEKESYKVISETIDLHDGKENKKVVALVPKNGKSNWATIENVFK